MLYFAFPETTNLLIVSDCILQEKRPALQTNPQAIAVRFAPVLVHLLAFGLYICQKPQLGPAQDKWANVENKG